MFIVTGRRFHGMASVIALGLLVETSITLGFAPPAYRPPFRFAAWDSVAVVARIEPYLLVPL